MNRKNLLIALAFSIVALGSSISTKAQYTPTVSEDNTWKMINFGFFVFEYTQFVEGDSIINEVTYKKLWSQNEGYPAYMVGLLREDVAEQKLYIFDGAEEKLLCDFTLEEGDESSVYGVGMMHDIVVTDVSTETMLGGELRKKITFTEAETYSGYWIEGMGSVNGLQDAAIGFVADYSPNVTCFYEGNDLSWAHPELGGECSLTLSVDDNLLVEAKLFPNPANDRIQFTLNSEMDQKPYTIAVYSITGQNVISEVCYNRMLNIEDMAPGIYTITFSQEGTMVSRASLIVE